MCLLKGKERSQKENKYIQYFTISDTDWIWETKKKKRLKSIDDYNKEKIIKSPCSSFHFPAIAWGLISHNFRNLKLWLWGCACLPLSLSAHLLEGQNVSVGVLRGGAQNRDTSRGLWLLLTPDIHLQTLWTHGSWTWVWVYFLCPLMSTFKEVPGIFWFS